MSGTSGTASTKGETTSSKSSKSGYDHLDINKLYKGKSTEPVAKTVTQKHGMQTLGKAPPARRGGNVVKTETTSSDVANSSAPKQLISHPPNIGQTAIHPPGWSNSSLSHPPGPPSPHNAPSVPTTGPPMHDKNWNGGQDRKGNFPSAAAQDKMQRFAQEFPSLDSGGDSGKGPTANAGGPGNAGHPQMSKNNQDNQYGPGPILRPQTEGSWTQGGSRGMPRPPGPPPQSGASTREFGQERPNLGGPTPPPMSVGQGGHPPPPMGAFPMQFPPRAPYMYPNSGPPPGPGGFYPPGPGMPRYGMPMHPGGPPPSNHPQDGSREPHPRGGRGPPPPRDLRPASHFSHKPIIKQEELERMDVLGQQDGGWATVQEDIDYNKKISFSDDEGEDRGKENSSSGRGGQSKSDRIAQRQDLDKREDDREPRRPVKILERQQPPSRNDRERGDQRESRYESERENQSGRYDYENEEDWKRKPAPGFDQKERDRGDRNDRRERVDRGERIDRGDRNERGDRGDRNERGDRVDRNERGDRGDRNERGDRVDRNERGDRVERGDRGDREDREDRGRGRVFREEDSWRSAGNSRFEEDPRAQRDQREKKGPVATPQNVRVDPRGGPQQFQSNLPPRLQRQHQQPPTFSSSSNQRKTPSPVPTSGSGNAVNKDRDFRDRDRPAYKILERNRGDSESSKDSNRDRRFGNDCDTVPVRLRDKESNKRLSSDSGKMKDEDETKMSPKGEMDSGDNDAKSSFRSKPPSALTSSWADEVADEEYNSRDDDDLKKGGGFSSNLKRDQVYPDERRPRENTVPRRVIIQQTKVENMRSDVKPEPVVEPKPEPVKPEKPVEKVKSSAWGDREIIREKSKAETDQAHKDPSSGKENDRDSHSSERESSQRAQKSDSSGSDSKFENTKENENDKSHHMEGKGSREKLDRDRHYDRYGSGGGRYDDRRQDNKDSNRTDNRNNSARDNRPKPRRMDSYETKRDNRTPDRDQYAGANRNSNVDANNSASRNSQEKEEKNKPNIEKSKSGDRLDSSKDKGLDRNEKDDYRRERENRDLDREKDYDRHNRNERDDYDSPRDRDRGHRGGRGGKERGGYGIYQPRGGNQSWGSDPKSRSNNSRGGGRGNSRDFYDSKPRRMDSEKDEKSFRKEEDNSRQFSESDNRDKAQEKSDTSNKGSVEDLGIKKKDKESTGNRTEGNSEKKGNKSPGTARRNARGGARLQGYGPPSDKNPFSSSQSHKDDDTRENKSSESQANSKPAPVPLMALGDISPPNMQSKSRHHGGVAGRDAGGRGRGVPPPRMQRDDYSFRGGSDGGRGNKRGGRSGDAKPLMSINSNEVEGNEWESGSESGDDESKRSRKEGVANKSGSDKFRQTQNVNRNGSAKTSSNTFNHTQDNANNNKGKGGGTTDTSRSSTSNFEIDCYSGHQTNPELSQHGNTSDNLESLDNESGGYQKKNAGSAKQIGDKSSMNSGQKNVRPDPKSTKDRRIKNPPYDPRPISKQQNQSSASNSSWEKSTVPSSQSKDNLSQPSTQSSNSTPTVESKDIPDTKPLNSTTIHPSSSVSNPSILDNTGPLKTMIFENTNFKSINSNTTKTSKPVEQKKEGGLPSNIDLGKDLQLGFGKVVGEPNTDIDFGTFNDPAVVVGSVGVSQQNHGPASSQAPSKMAIGQTSRSFVSHQPSPISPQAADLNEKVQSVKRIWEMPTMPSVAEQNSVCGSDDNSFHGGFDTFKGSDGSGREFTSSLQQPTSGYAPGSSPALSAISKPDSSSSPTSSNLRISKPQQNSLDNQGQSGISSSPFGGYTMPQPQGSNAFSGMPAVPSPPSVMYGTSQTLHAAAPPSGMYQTFPHVDASQGMGVSARTQYQQYPSQAATSGHYGLFLQTPMDYQSMSYNQHQQGSQGPPGQAPNQSSRISPGPMTTTGGGNSAGVIISSTNSIMNMKPQSATGSHPSMQHQVVPGSQQGYSQLSHHHPAAALSHQQHHLGAVGPAKGGYSQSGMATQSQTPVFIPFDPQQSVINLGQNFLSSAMRSGPPGGPPPPATPPVQALQSSSYYSGSSGNQGGVYPQSNQGQSLQQLHVAVAPNHQGMPGMHSGNPQYGLGYPTQLNLQSYNQQAAAAASTVSALNLSNQLIRNAGPTSHSYMKQPGMDMVQQSQLKSSHDPSMMSQNTWNSPGFSLNQAFHGGNKAGNNQNRNDGNSIGNQRKGNNHPGNVGNMKYMSSQGPGGYTGQVPQ